MKPELMGIGTGGVAVVEGLESPKMVLSASPLKATVTLMAGCLDNLQLAIKCVYLGHDVKHLRVRLVVAGKLGDQPPVVCAAGQFNGLVVGR